MKANKTDIMKDKKTISQRFLELTAERNNLKETKQIETTNSITIETLLEPVKPIENKKLLTLPKRDNYKTEIEWFEDLKRFKREAEEEYNKQNNITI